MIVGNSFNSFSYNIQQGLKDNQPPANPAPASSPVDSNQQGQHTQPKRGNSNLDPLGQGYLP
ncbi:hypothetical protein DK871_07960 [Pseudomonas sp. L13]|nr:hypothetical protein [Pseudomonas sp. L13]